MSSTSVALSIPVREILERIGSESSISPLDTSDIILPGPSTPESLALENSLRSLVARFQELELKSISSPPSPDVLPFPKSEQNVKERSNDESEKHTCMSCGDQCDTVLLKPKETPSVVDIGGSYVPKLTVSSPPPVSYGYTNLSTWI